MRCKVKNPTENQSESKSFRVEFIAWSDAKSEELRSNF